MSLPPRTRSALSRLAVMATVMAPPSAAVAAAGDNPPIAVLAGPTGLTLEAKLGDCSATLARESEDPALLYHDDCRQDLPGRTALLARMVEAALPHLADPGAGLSIRIASLDKTFPDFARRLAQAAARSPEWYGERAKRDPGFASQTILKIANTPPVYRELQEAMRPVRLAVRMAQVENPLIAVPPETPFADWLADRGIDPRKQVPYDAQVVFRLTPL